MFEYVPNVFKGLAYSGKHAQLMTTPTINCISCSNVHVRYEQCQICFAILTECISLMFPGIRILINTAMAFLTYPIWFAISHTPTCIKYYLLSIPLTLIVMIMDY
jgi:hypothetical protein